MPLRLLVGTLLLMNFGCTKSAPRTKSYTRGFTSTRKETLVKIIARMEQEDINMIGLGGELDTGDGKRYAEVCPECRVLLLEAGVYQIFKKDGAYFCLVGEEWVKDKHFIKFYIMGPTIAPDCYDTGWGKPDGPCKIHLENNWFLYIDWITSDYLNITPFGRNHF